jgi:hypothetical protein
MNRKHTLLMTTTLLSLALQSVPSFAQDMSQARATEAMESKELNQKEMTAAVAAMAPSNTVTINCTPGTSAQTQISTGTSAVQWKVNHAGNWSNANVVTNTTAAPFWTAQTILTGAQWVHKSTSTAATAVPQGVYIYQIKIDVKPTCQPVLQRVFIEGRAAASTKAVATLHKMPNASGFPAALGNTPNLPGSIVANIFSVFQPTILLAPGTYLLRFRVQNPPFNGQLSPEGLIFQGFIMH